MTHTFKTRYGPWALITGAARGLGAEFARQCAERGLNVLLVDVRGDELKEVAARIEASTGREAKRVTVDLSSEDFMKPVARATEFLDIGLLVNNAGISRMSGFLEDSQANLTAQLHVNCRAPMTLSHHFGLRMKERKKGGILFVSSASSFLGSSHIAHYAATKAYLRILGEGLWQELAPRGIQVQSFVAGITESPGLMENGPVQESGIRIMPVREAVRTALDSLGSGPVVVPGRLNRWAFGALQFLPRKFGIRRVSATIEKYFGLK